MLKVVFFCLFWVVTMFLTQIDDVEAARIQLNSGRIFEADIIKRDDTKVVVKYFDAEVTFYTHEIAVIDNQTSISPGDVLLRSLYAVYKEAQRAKADVDIQAYANTLSRDRLQKLSQNQKQWATTLELMNRSGLSNRIPETPLYAYEKNDHAFLYLQNLSQDEAVLRDYMSFKKRTTKRVRRITFQRYPSGWKMDRDEHHNVPLWLDLKTWENLQAKTDWNPPDNWTIKSQDTNDAFLFGHTDVSHLAMGHTADAIYWQLRFKRRPIRDLSQLRIFINTAPGNLEWLMNEAEQKSDPVGWQMKVVIRKVNLINDTQDQFEVALMPDEKSESLVLKGEKGWLKSLDYELWFKIPRSVFDLNSMKQLQFIIKN